MLGAKAAHRPHGALLSRRGAPLDGTALTAGGVLHRPSSLPAWRASPALQPISASGQAARPGLSDAAPADPYTPPARRKPAKVRPPGHHYDPNATVGGAFRNLLGLAPLALPAAGPAAVPPLALHAAAGRTSVPESHRGLGESAHGKPRNARVGSASRRKRPLSSAAAHRTVPEALPPLAAVDLPGSVSQGAHVDPVAVIRRTSLPSVVEPNTALRRAPAGRQLSSGWRRGSVKPINTVTEFELSI